jgi:tetratricopeptide (TPR) repeat protein
MMLSSAVVLGPILFALQIAAGIGPSTVQPELLTAHSSRTIRLEPKSSLRLRIDLHPGECARLQLHLQGGLISIASNQHERWGIDLGRGGILPYIVTPDEGANAKEGAYIDVASLEHEKPAEVEVFYADRSPCTQNDRDLQHAEESLTAAEAARRRWKPAPSAEQAAKLYEEAALLAERLQNVPLERFVKTQHARYLLFQQTRFEDAKALLLEATALPPSGDAAQQALAYKTLSSVEADLSEYDAAIAAAGHALDLYRTNGDVYWQGIVLGNVSSVYTELGQYGDAIRTAQEALADAKSEKDAAGVVYCLAQLANTYRLQGDFEGAFRDFREGLRWVDQISYSPLVEAEIRGQMGTYYANLGQWQEAADAFTRCLRLEGARDDPTALEARGTLAVVLQQQHKLPSAETAYSLAIETATRLRLPREQRMLLLQRAEARASLGNEAGALSDIAAATALTGALDSPAVQLQLALTQARVWQLSDASKSEDFYAKAIALAGILSDREDEAAAHAGLAAVEQKLGKLEQALSSIDLALHALEQNRSALSSRQLAVSYFSLRHAWYALAIDLSMQLDATHPGGDYAERAFHYAERARARALLDAVSSRDWHNELNISAELKREIALNQSAIEERQEQLDQSDGQVSQAQSSELLKLYQQQDALNAEVKFSDPRTAGLLQEVVSVADIQRNLLSNSSALLAYWLGEKESYCWIVTANHFEVRRLPAQHIVEETVLPLEQQLQRRQPLPLPGEDAAHYAVRSAEDARLLHVRLRRGGTMLLPSLPPETHQLFIVGDAALLALPWNALTLKDTRFAIEHYLILNEPSASVALRLQLQPQPDPSGRIAVVSGNGVGSTHPRGDNVFLPLTSAIREANFIKSAGGHRVVVLEAPEIHAQMDAEGYSILHFAAHTLTNGQSAELTGLRFSNDRNTHSVDTLWLHDIYAMKHVAPVVVLSGCETEGAVQMAGEGINSLAQAFFFAGAHQVIGSLWNVDDARTSELMGSFYHAMLVERQSPAAALRFAQLRMLHSGAATIDWAAFVINGVSKIAGYHD